MAKITQKETEINIKIKIKSTEIQANLPDVKYFPKPNYQEPKYSKCSIVDALRSVGYDSSQAYRLKIGNRNNIPGPAFCPQYNITMLNLMKEGKLIIP